MSDLAETQEIDVVVPDEAKPPEDKTLEEHCAAEGAHPWKAGAVRAFHRLKADARISRDEFLKMLKAESEARIGSGYFTPEKSTTPEKK